MTQTQSRDSHNTSNHKSPRIGIIGAGAGGLCMGIRLLEAGYSDFVIFEKADGVGGTWYHNRYPGCACDVPSHLYSFSFEQKADWPRPFAEQPLIRAYMDHCADKYGLRPHLRLGTGIARASWNEENSTWALVTEAGEQCEFDVVVSAIGMFNELSWSGIPGRARFAGQSFHSARWDWDYDLSGKRVGVIGSAASAVQFVPEIAKEVAQLDLYQRTANWVAPKEDEPFSAEQIAVLESDRGALTAVREAIHTVVNQTITFSDEELMQASVEGCLGAIQVVEDPVVRDKLTPKHPFGCKRPLLSNNFYPTFNRPNVELVTDLIAEIIPEGVRLESGETREYDALIFATGFETSKYLMALDVRGRGGRHIEEAWSDGATAYLGVTTSGFPNLFMLYGPNTNNGSILYMIECQVDYSLRKIQRLERDGLAWIDVRPESMESYNAELQKQIAQVEVWGASCNGYYRSASGRIVTQWPHTMDDFRDQLAAPDDDAFEVGLAG